MQHGEIEKLNEEVLALREEVTSLQRRIALIDRELGPVWAEEDEIKAAIRGTHGVNKMGGIVFKAAGAAERKPMFDALLAISIEHGPTREGRKQLAQLMRSYERRADNMEKELERKRKSKRKKPDARTLFD